MTSATALKFPVAPGSLELAKSVAMFKSVGGEFTYIDIAEKSRPI